MKAKNIHTVVLSVALLAMGAGRMAAQDQAAAQTLSAAEIDTLVAPLALYPDPLISQILPASTYPDDIHAAATWLAQNPNNPAAIDAQKWDVSVKAVAHYPQAIQKMDGDLDWTLALGQAYTLQQEAVLESIQRLRALARNAGTLQSTPQQTVVAEQDDIRIVPAQPEVVYVPQYDPEVVYVAGPPYRPGLLVFGTGLLIGAWLNTDLDWHTHRVYYHGWEGSGWVAHSRPFVRTNRAYVDESFRLRPQVNPAYRSRPMVVNRTYVTRHADRYEFNRNRGATAMDRIKAARERSATQQRTAAPAARSEREGGRAASPQTKSEAPSRRPESKDNKKSDRKERE